MSLPDRLLQLLRSPWVRCLILFVIGIAVRSPALSGELLWDDDLLVRDNPFVKSPVLIAEAFRHHLFPDAFSGHYRPVQTISYISDYFFWNKNPFGYHLSNVLWHVLGGILLYHLLNRLLRSFGDRWPASALKNQTCFSAAAFFLALIWIVHPVHSAAVDYISGRADSLAFCFACAGWLLYLRALELPCVWKRRGLFLLAALSALLSLCSRETGALWLLMFLIYVFAFERKQPLRSKLLALTVCLVIAASYMGLRQLPEHHPDSTAAIGWSPATRGILMLRALGDYGRLLIFPTRLHIERTILEPFLGRAEASWRSAMAFQGLTIGGALMLGILVLGAFRKGAGQPLRCFGASWFLLTYLPISNLFELNATVAEHWLYLPSVGFLLFVSGIFLDLPVRYFRVIAVCAAVAAVGLSAQSVFRSSDWADPETFFRRTFAAGGASSRIGLNLAVIYATKGEHAKAEAILRKVLEVSPNYSLARNNLAIALSRQGKTAEADALLETASQPAADKGGYSQTPDGIKNLARLRHKEGKDAEAFQILDKALREFPGNWPLVRLQAEIIRETQGSAKALPIVQNFVRQHWWHAGASISLAGLLLETDQSSQATAALSNASRLDVHDVEALNLMAMISIGEDRLEDAYEIERRAIARQPNEPRQYLILSDILQKMGRTDEARAALTQVNAVNPVAN